MSMSYSKNIMELTKNVDILNEVGKSIETDKDADEINEFIKRYVAYMNRKIKTNEFDARKKERAEMNTVNVYDEESASFEVVFPETPESANIEEKTGPTTPDEKPPTSINEIGPTTPDEAPPTTNEPEIDFGTKEYNDFYQSLPMKSKKMIMDLPPRDRLWK
jgi:hypothetical protein